MKQKKSTIKFLKNAKKNAKPGNQKTGSAPPKKFHNKKRPQKSRDSDDEGESEDESSKPVKYKVPSSSGMKKHKGELQSLEEADPEFFNYLKENDSGLLEFGQSDDDEDEEDDMEEEGEEDGDDDDAAAEDNSDDDDDEENGESGDDSEEEEEAEVFSRGRKARQSKGRIEVTEELLASIAKNALAGSIPELKKLLSIFRSACNPNGEDSLSEEAEAGKSMSRYQIASPEIYEQVMLTCIGTIGRAFRLHVDLKEGGKGAAKQLEGLGKHPKWKKLQLLVLSFFKSILHTLEGLADHAQQSQVSVFLIESLESYVPFLAPLPRLAKGVIKVLLNVWAYIPTSEGETVGDTLNVRGHAFLRIRQMSLVLPGAIAEECFRAIYLKYARQCKNFTEMNATSVTFMAQCIAELYSVDRALAYQQSFLYIRQLALHVRTSFVKKSAETTRQITSWQFLNCLRLWTRVVCALPSEADGLGALAFPLAQIMFGVMSSCVSIYFVPLRFHLVACLHQLAANCKLFIPTAAQLLEVLDCGDLVSKPTPSTDVAPKLQYMVKLATDSIHKVTVRDVVVQEAVNLLRQDCEVYRFHVGFPEYAYLTSRKLRAFSKACKVSKWRDTTKTLIGQMDQFASFCKKQRTKLGKAPMAIVEFEPLLGSAPAGTAVSSVRLNKLLANSKMNVASEVNVSELPKSAAPTKNLFKGTFELSKTSRKKVAKKTSKGRGNDSDSGEGSEEEGSESDEEEEEGEGSYVSEDDVSEKEDSEAMDEDEEGDNNVPENVDGFQDSVQELAWDDDE